MTARSVFCQGDGLERLDDLLRSIQSGQPRIGCCMFSRRLFGEGIQNLAAAVSFASLPENSQDSARSRITSLSDALRIGMPANNKSIFKALPNLS